jgi:hypothetical protein
LALELPERSLPIETVRLAEHLQPPLPKPQGQSHALLERKTKHLLLKLIPHVIGDGSHGVSISRGALPFTSERLKPSPHLLRHQPSALLQELFIVRDLAGERDTRLP